MILGNKIRFRKKGKRAAIFFDIEKAYDKVNRKKTHEQLENMVIQGRIMELIKELIGERYIKVSVMIHFTEQTDRLGNSTGRGA